MTERQSRILRKRVGAAEFDDKIKVCQTDWFLASLSPRPKNAVLVITGVSIILGCLYVSRCVFYRAILIRRMRFRALILLFLVTVSVTTNAGKMKNVSLNRTFCQTNTLLNQCSLE